MNIIKTCIFLLLFIPLAVTGATFSWVYPTKRTDNTPLPASEIASANIKCSQVQGGPYVLVQAVPYPATEYAATLANDGYWYCIGTVTGKGASAGEGPPGGELKFFTLAGTVIANPTAPAALGGFSVK